MFNLKNKFIYYLTLCGCFNKIKSQFSKSFKIFSKVLKIVFINNALIKILTRSENNIFLYYFKILKDLIFSNFNLTSQDNYLTKFNKMFIYISLVLSRIILLLIIQMILIYFNIFCECFIFTVLANETVYIIWRQNDKIKEEKCLLRWKYFFYFTIINQFYFYIEDFIYFSLFKFILLYIWRGISLIGVVYITSNLI